MISIYIISNDVNNKVYVGKTKHTLSKRFNEHIRESRRKRSIGKPFYDDIRKYGYEHFQISLIEQCSESDSNKREQFWISEYKLLNSCYNVALGGIGKPLFDHSIILDTIIENPYPIIAAKMIGCSTDLIHRVAADNGIKLYNRGQKININQCKQVCQLSMDRRFVRKFNSVQEAAVWCYNNNICKALNSGVRGHIADCANGKVNSAYGYLWTYD